MTTTHSRAKKGGEYGANGEWYEGGKFISTTDRAKGKPQQRKTTGRREIESGVWVEVVEGKLTLWSVLAGVEIWNRDENTFSFNSALCGHFADKDAIARRTQWITAWNNGERWRDAP